MLYDGEVFSLTRDDDGVLTLTFDAPDGKVNVFNRTALKDFGDALDAVERAVADGAVGLVLASAKDGFIAGADITEFLGYFNSPDEELAAMLGRVNGDFNRLEDLAIPTAVAINGAAQGGGFEVCLACDYRVLSPEARIGLPEVKLGIMPGWGGSVRLSRLVGYDTAFEWMCTGDAKRPDVALKDGAADAVVARDQLVDIAKRMVLDAHAGKLDYRAQRARKTEPLTLSDIERTMAFESARGVVGAKAGPHYPAPLTIIATVERHAGKRRGAALADETVSFVKLAKTDVAASLVGIFLKDQTLKRLARQQSKAARPVHRAAVLGAGIMGGGVAYQSASNGVPIVMKDIRREALDAGLAEASQLLGKQVARGKLKPEGVPPVLNAILPALGYGEFGDVDIVVEAVVEKLDVKRAVLADVEGEVGDGTVLTTNTSTISVNALAEGLKRPENFCGMHFFNPVHRMPLVEVIRSDRSSEAAIATTVAYAQAMRKTPIVVNDCPGFLVNRILFAYFVGFEKLVQDGADIRKIDRAMEGFGWPMGPAWLLDVIGIDTARHAADVIAEGFPDRMTTDGQSVIAALHEADRLGQKNGRGFYRYETDRKGRAKKIVDETALELVASTANGTIDPDAETIVDRLMIPLCIESARCLEDGIVGTAAEVDMGLVYGVGFPPFRGGALQYVDRIGIAAFCESADRYAELGPLYHPTDDMRSRAETGRGYHVEADAGNAAAQSGETA